MAVTAAAAGPDGWALRDKQGAARQQEVPSRAAAAAGTARGHRAELGRDWPRALRPRTVSGADSGRNLRAPVVVTSAPGARGWAVWRGEGEDTVLGSRGTRGVAMNIVVEFFVVTFKVLWAFVLAAARWLVRPKEKSVAGQVCLITGAGSGLGRLFALEFARRRALLVLWDINTQSNEETAGMVRHIYRDLEAADAAALQGNCPACIVKSNVSPPGRVPTPHGHGQPRSPGKEHLLIFWKASGICPLIRKHDFLLLGD